MPYLPIYIHSSKVRVLVVGGGNIALRKLKNIIDSQTKVAVIAKSFSVEFKEFMALHQIDYTEKPYEKGDASGYELVIAATSHKETNDLIQADADHWINRVDSVEKGNILLPATIRRGEFVLTVSTGSASPLLAKKIKQDLEQQFDEGYESYIKFLSRVREKYSRNHPILRAVVDEEFINMTDTQREFKLESLVKALL